MHWYLKLRNSVFFNMTIRVFLESFIEIALTAAINIKNVRNILNIILSCATTYSEISSPLISQWSLDS